MARVFTDTELALITGGRLKARLLVTFFMDDGTYRFCDDVFDLTDGTNTYMGASALISVADIKSGAGFAAEGLSIIVDGNRINQTGFSDPAAFFRTCLAEVYHQRRVNLVLGIMAPESQTITLEIPLYAGLINNIKLVDPAFDSISSGDPTKGVSPPQGQMILSLDSLASRYGYITYRTRSQADQQDLDSTDQFYSYVNSVVQNEQILYWGMNPPAVLPNLGTPYNSRNPSSLGRYM